MLIGEKERKYISRGYSQIESADGSREKSALICEKRKRWVHTDRRRLKYTDGRRKSAEIGEKN